LCGSVEIVSQHAHLQALERRGVGRKTLLANETWPSARTQGSAGTRTQKECAPIGPREVALQERQEKGFERPIFAAVSAHQTLRRAVASP
jgi:hypothetical protein